MSPNRGREALLTRMVAGFKVDGIVDLTWQACHTYTVEAFQSREFSVAIFRSEMLILKYLYFPFCANLLHIMVG